MNPLNPLLVEPKGILVVGTRPQCGKTILAAGLAGVLFRLGCHAEPAKPLGFYPPVSLNSQQEQTFFRTVIRLAEWQEPINLPSPYEVTSRHWQVLVENMRKRVYPVIMESPAPVAGTVGFQAGRRLDIVDLAKMLNLVILLAVPKQPDPAAELLPALAYLNSRNTSPLGFVGIEAQPANVPIWDQVTLALMQETMLPYLGTVPYDPSVSQEVSRPGNLLTTVEDSIDLLPLQQALQMTVP